MTKKRVHICPKRKSAITKTHYSLQCAGNCANWYHKHCTGLTDTEFLAFEKRKTEVKWVCQSCSSGSSSDCSDDENSNNPSNKDILKTINKKFAELEAAVTFNGNIMEDLQNTIKSLAEENKQLKAEQSAMKNKIIIMEKEINSFKSSVEKGERAERRKNIVISGLKGDDDLKTNLKKVLLRLSVTDTEYETLTLPTTDSNKPLIVVKFPSAEIRDRLLEKLKTLRLNTSLWNRW
nr:unnamed protein product [Callosobruchus analis]